MNISTLPPSDPQLSDPHLSTPADAAPVDAAPVDAAPAPVAKLPPAVALAEFHKHLQALHDTVMDATSPERVYSRRELRRRACRLAKRLRSLLEGLAPAAGTR